MTHLERVRRNREIGECAKAGIIVPEIANRFQLTNTMIHLILKQLKIPYARPSTFGCGHPRSEENTYKSMWKGIVSEHCARCKRNYAKRYAKQGAGVRLDGRDDKPLLEMLWR